MAHLESTNWLTVYPDHDPVVVEKLTDLAESIGDFPDTEQIVQTLEIILASNQYNGTPLTTADRALFSEVLQFIHKGLELQMDSTVSLQGRKQTDSFFLEAAQREADQRREVETWSFFSGDYRGQLVGESHKVLHSFKYPPHYLGNSEIQDSETYVPHEYPGDVVHFMYKRIEQLLENTQKRPIIIVDIGAMYAGTLLELAAAYREQVIAGEVAFVATNIGLTKELIEQVRRPRNGLKFPNNYEDLYAQANNLVHFVRSDVSQLASQELVLPNGTTCKIGPGMLDIIHENWSLSVHSHSLEKDVAVLGTLLSADGILLSQKRSAKRADAGISPRVEDETAPFIRALYSRSILGNVPTKVEELDILDEFVTKNITHDMKVRATRNLAKLGFNQMDTAIFNGAAYELNYTVWAGDRAIPVQFYQENRPEPTLAQPDTKKKLRVFEWGEHWKKRLQKILGGWNG